MAMTPERSNPLHNFHLPPRLSWGTQRHLRCKRPDEDDERSDLAGRSDGGSQIEAIGKKLMMNFKLKIDKMKVVGTTEEGMERAATPVVVEGESESSPSRPWNLRVRRRSTSPAAEGGGAVVVVRRKKKFVIRERCLRGFDDVEEKVVKKLRVGLEREEIEKDFVAMGGIKLPRRPKKRPRAIQKDLDTLFPGLWLSEVNLQRYAVREAPES